MVTVAPGTTAPEESLMVPRTVAVGTCANTGIASNNSINATTNFALKRTPSHVSFFATSHPPSCRTLPPAYSKILRKQSFTSTQRRIAEPEGIPSYLKGTLRYKKNYRRVMRLVPPVEAQP